MSYRGKFPLKKSALKAKRYRREKHCVTGTGATRHHYAGRHRVLSEVLEFEFWDELDELSESGRIMSLGRFAFSAESCGKHFLSTGAAEPGYLRSQNGFALRETRFCCFRKLVT